ncbi:MAG: hypothetical protein ABIR29_06525, partial [Chthoniobacterales bacterium]
MSRATDFLLTAEELRLRRQKRRRLTFAVVVLVLLVVLGSFSARPASHAIKSWQARRHAKKAFGLIEAEKWSDAQKEAIAAYQLRASEPEAIRAVARFLSRTRQPQALGFWKALREKEPLTRQDSRDEAAVALSAGETSSAEAAIAILLGKREGGPAPADWLLAAQLAAQNQAPEKLSEYLEKVISDPKATERHVFQASLFQLAATNSGATGAREIQTAAWTRLTKMARGKNDVALDALTILAQHALSSPNEIVSDPAIMPETELIHALETHPLSRAAQKLLAIDLRVRLDPDQKENLITQAATAWGKSDNESLAVLARWINGKGEYQRGLDTIP